LILVGDDGFVSVSVRVARGCVAVVRALVVRDYRLVITIEHGLIPSRS
jgi:hypothetical protein